MWFFSGIIICATEGDGIRNHTAFYIDKHTYTVLVGSIYKRHASSLSKIQRYEANLIANGKDYLNIAKNTSKLPLKELSNKTLLNLYIDYQDKLFKFTVYVFSTFILNNYIADQATILLSRYLELHRLQNQKAQIIRSLFQPIKLASNLKLQHEVEKNNGIFTKERRQILFRPYWREESIFQTSVINSES